MAGLNKTHSIQEYIQGIDYQNSRVYPDGWWITISLFILGSSTMQSLPVGKDLDC